MSFENAMNKMKFDIRLLDYNLSHGYITKEDYNKYKAQLEDLSSMVAPLNSEAADQGTDEETED